MVNNHVINTLNDFLKGQYMGIHAYENYIQKISDEQIKRELQKIQQELKNDASKVAERIQNLGENLLIVRASLVPYKVISIILQFQMIHPRCWKMR